MGKTTKTAKTTNAAANVTAEQPTTNASAAADQAILDSVALSSPEAIRDALAKIRMYADAHEVLQTALEHDANALLGDGLTWEEIADGMRTWPNGDVVGYIAESYIPGPDKLPMLRPFEKDSPDYVSASAAAAMWRALLNVGVKPPTWSERPTTAAEPEKPAEPTTAEPTTAADTPLPSPEAGGPDQAAQAMAKSQEDAARAEEEARDALEKNAKAMVKAYCKGEHAYRNGLLEAGKYAHLVIVGKLALGDKRKAGVDYVKSTLGLHASEDVDPNRLIRCWAAWSLLCESQQIDAKSVPYGHYRDAWSHLVQRVEPDTGREHWALLPGMESDCLLAFREATANGLSRDACKERANAIVRTHTERLAREAREREEKAKREREEKERQEREAKRVQEEKERQEREAREARERQEREAQAAATKAQQAPAETDEQRAERERLAEQARADEQKAREARERELLARQQADEAKRVADEARFKAEDAARREAQAKEDARKASDRQAEAEAKKARADKAKESKDGGKVEKGEKGEKSQESKAGPNLLVIAKMGAPADVAAMAYDLIVGSNAPDDVLLALLTGLDGCKELSKPSLRAIQAARLTLAKPATTADKKAS